MENDCELLPIMLNRKTDRKRNSWSLGLVSAERLEKPGIESATPGLEGEQLNHYATEASRLDMTTSMRTYLI